MICRVPEPPALPDEQHTDRIATALAALRRALEDPAVEVRREAAWRSATWR